MSRADADSVTSTEGSEESDRVSESERKQKIGVGHTQGTGFAMLIPDCYLHS